MSACPREYDVIRRIREGNRGVCNSGILVVRHRASGKRCVEKRFVPEHVRAGLARHEIVVHGRMDHKNIVKIVDYYISPRNTTTSMFLEYCNAGSIRTLIIAHAQNGTHISESMVRNVFRQISKALDYCHYGPANIRRNWTPIIHKDIKPGDFGCAERMGERLHAGTPAFCPPEFPNSVEESDVWQLGATVSCMCTLQEVPNPSLIPGTRYTQRLRALILRCGSYRVRERPRSIELLQILTREVEILRDQLRQVLEPPLLYDRRYL